MCPEFLSICYHYTCFFFEVKLFYISLVLRLPKVKENGTCGLLFSHVYGSYYGKRKQAAICFFPSGSVSVMQKGPTFYLLCYLCPNCVLRSALLWAPADKVGPNLDLVCRTSSCLELTLTFTLTSRAEPEMSRHFKCSIGIKGWPFHLPSFPPSL